MATRPSVRLVGSAGPGEGRGHAGRLVTMAEALAPRADVRVELLLGAFTTGEAERLAAAGIDWRNGGARREPDAVIVDVPWPDAIAARWRAERLVVFDDSHRLSANVAVVVQPSLPAWHGAARASTILAGYAFAPIRPSIRRLASEDLVPAAPPEVVVCFGGGDPADVTARVAPAIAAAVGERAHLTIVVGASYAGALRDERGDELVRDPADLDSRVARSTLAVIGGGMMKQEAAHLGVPTITVAVADDQLV
ncbi:MAG TPA: hypothetical protein VFP22_01770, partial [Candidatus Limnocylindrales bacterium]|nr:hypothetical protein [Candidatus Limnocylindrales bacterium]